MNEFPGLQNSQSSVTSQFGDDGAKAAFPWKLMIFSIVFFLFFVVVYFGIVYGYEPYLTKTTETTKSEAKALEKKVSYDKQNELINFYSQISNLKKVYGNHIFVFNILSFLEKNIVNGVYITKISYDSTSNRLNIEGVAPNNDALVQQLKEYSSPSQVSEAVLTQMRYDEKQRIIFSARMSFVDKALKTQQ